MSDANKQIHVFISGLVQGVFFRKTTQERALTLGLTGWVRNRKDGRVEATVSGDESTLLTMLNWLGKGPVTARVNNVSIRWTDECKQEVFTGFTILDTY